MDDPFNNAGGNVIPGMAHQQAASLASFGDGSSNWSGVLPQNSSEPVVWNNNFFLSQHVFFHPQSPPLANAMIWDAATAAISQSSSLFGLLPSYQFMGPPLTTNLGSKEGNNTASDQAYFGNNSNNSSVPGVLSQSPRCGLFGDIGTGAAPTRLYEWGLPPRSLADIIGLSLPQQQLVSAVGMRQAVDGGLGFPRNLPAIGEGTVRSFSMGALLSPGETAVKPPASANLKGVVAVGAGSAARTRVVRGTHKPKLRKTCDACSKHKKACSGSKPCCRCTQRQKVCIFSMRKRTGPKGPKKRPKRANDQPVVPRQDEVVAAAANPDAKMSAAVQEGYLPPGPQARSAISGESGRDTDGVSAADPIRASILRDSGADGGGGILRDKEDRAREQGSSNSRGNSNENGDEDDDDIAQVLRPPPGVRPFDRSSHSAGGNCPVSAEPYSDSSAVIGSSSSTSSRDVNDCTSTSTGNDGDSTARGVTSSWQASLLISDRDIVMLPTPELATERCLPVADEELSTPAAKPGTPLASQSSTPSAAVSMPTPALNFPPDQAEAENLIMNSFIVGSLSEREEGTNVDDPREVWEMAGCAGFDPRISVTGGGLKETISRTKCCGYSGGTYMVACSRGSRSRAPPPLISTRQDDLDGSADGQRCRGAGTSAMETGGAGGICGGGTGWYELLYLEGDVSVKWNGATATTR